MRLFLLPLFIVIGINLFVDFAIYKKLSSEIRHSHFAKIAHITLSLLLGALIIFLIGAPNSFVGNNTSSIGLCIYTYFCIYVPKYVFLLLSSFSKIAKHDRVKQAINTLSLLAAIGVFVIMLHASLVTRRSIQRNNIVLEYPNLPEQFDGYRFIQFSDFHLGSLGNDTTFVKDVVDFINAQNVDAIFFTGDLVNSRAEEVVPFVNTLKQLKARDGVISILGNHDYSEYHKWNSEKEKLENRKRLEFSEKQSGWLLLKNSHVNIHRGNDSIAIIGVENWGEPPFPKYGNLEASYTDLNDNTFKILLSHNPNHWKGEVIHNTNIDLMLAGHTHAMQILLHAFGMNISPASLRYDEWAGLYQQGTQRLYVNIGVGCIGMPARFGAKPEITVFTLKKK